MKQTTFFIVYIFILCAVAGPIQAGAQTNETPSYVSVWESDQFVMRWLICGPFPNPRGKGRDTDYLVSAGGEAKIRPKTGVLHPSASVASGSVRWREASASADGMLDFVKFFSPHDHVTAYAFCYIRAPEEMHVILKFGSDNEAKIWLNGKLIFDKKTGRDMRPDEDTVPAHLLAGDNALLVKVDQRIFGWGLCLQSVRAFPLGDGVFVGPAQFGPVLAGREGRASASMSIFNANDRAVTIDSVQWEESDWLDAVGIPVGELASEKRQKLSFQVRNRQIQESSLPVQVRVSAYRGGAEMGNTTIDAYSDVLKPLDAAESGLSALGFEASSDGAIRPYLIYLPEDYTPEQPTPLLIALTPTDSLDTYFTYGLKEHADAEGLAVMCLNERPGTGWGQFSIQDVLDCLGVVQSRLAIDADRIYLFGAGKGGNGVSSLGLQYPHLFAAMAVAEGFGPADLTRNALNLPVYVVNSTWPGRNRIPIESFREMVRLLSSHGCNVKHKEYPDDMRWPQFISEEWGAIFDWFREYRRVAYPERVSYSAGQLSGESGAYWVRISPGKDAYTTPQVDASVKGNIIDVSIVNVGKYSLLLSGELIDLTAPVTVRTNGEVSFSGRMGAGSIKDNAAMLVIDLQPKKLRWIFALAVGVVALSAIGLVILRLLKSIKRGQQEVTMEEPKLTAGIRGIWLIATKEFRLHLLTERFMWTTILCLGMVSMSFWLMTHDYQERLDNHSFSLRKPQNLFRGNLFWYNLRPGRGTGGSVYVRPTPIIKKPDVMSIFVQGLDRRIGRPAYYSLHQELGFEDMPHTNLLMDMFARPDLMYIVQIAMSLLALLFVFRSISGEREDGTLKLMMANAVPRDIILLGKWVGGYLGLILPFLLAVGMGVVALNFVLSVPLSTEHWIRLAWIILASLLYISVFFTLGILISALTKRTMTSFLAALFAWVIIVLVFPNIGTLVARELKPVESVQQLQVKRYAMKRKMEDEREKVRHSSQGVSGYGLIHHEIWHDIRERTWNLDAEHRRRTQQLADYTRILTRLSPAAAYSYAVMDIAGTNIGDELAYHDQLRRFIRNQPDEAHRYIQTLVYAHKVWKFQYMRASWQDGVMQALIDLMLLVLVNVILFLLAYLAFMRYEITWEGAL